MDRIERARRARLGVVCLVAAIALACFARVVQLGFAYDDRWTMVENRALERPLPFLLRATLRGSPATRAIPDSTRPAMMTSAWIDRRLFGVEPAGYHAHSLLLYALCSAAAALSLFALTRRTRIALAGGAFFAVAPVHAEAVACVSYREDLISGLAVLAVLAWLFSPRARPERSGGAALIAGVWLIGLLAKESAVGLVLLTAGMIAIRRPSRAWFRARKRSLVALSAVLVVWGGWRIWLNLRGVDDVPLAPRAGPLATLLATARYEVQALVGSLAPFAWSPEWDPEGPASPLWIAPLAAALAVTVWLARRRVTRPLALGIAIALLAPLATSPLVGPANQRADRYLFVAVLGGALVWGFLADRLLGALRRPGFALVALSPLLVAMTAASQAAAAAWKDDHALWRVASERAPRSYRSWVGLSRAQRLEGDLDAAEASIERAIQLFPESRSAHVSRAYLKLARGDVASAREDIQRVRDLGGARQRGLRRAERCAALAPDEARACIDGQR
jgi:protein O-mannosyl-transferase